MVCDDQNPLLDTGQLTLTGVTRAYFIFHNNVCESCNSAPPGLSLFHR